MNLIHYKDDWMVQDSALNLLLTHRERVIRISGLVIYPHTELIRNRVMTHNSVKRLEVASIKYLCAVANDKIGD